MMKISPLARLAASAALLSLSVLPLCPAQAQAQLQEKDGGNATDAVNPHSPRYAHPYRHGAHPTREQHEKMSEWARTHHPQHPGGVTGKFQPATTGAQTLAYNGDVDGIGVTSGTPRVYLVFWGSQWGTEGTDANGHATFSGDAKGAAPYMQKWIAGLGTNNELWSGVMTQYCDGPLVARGATSCPASAPHVGYPSGGGVLAGVWYDNAAAAPSAATGHQIGAEAVRAAAHFGNTTAAENRYVQYVIMSPTSTKPDGFNTAGGGFCAWHDFTGDTTLSGGAVSSTYGDIAFTNMPYVADMGSSCGASSVSSPLDGFSIVGGHEYAETLTDQNPAGGWINQTGSASNGEENGDECAWITSGQGATALVAFATGSFAMQSTWSNDTNRCDIAHAVVTGGGGTPVANFASSASGLAVKFTDTSTDTGGSITSHAWNFGDGHTSTTASPSHTFAASGTYSVTESVADSASGRSSAKTESVTVTSTGGTPVANFSYTTSGTAAKFTDKSTDSGGTIGSHAWTFGDGGTSTAASPSHTYASAGTYTVTETVKDSISGASSSKSSAVTVSPATSSELLANTGFEGTASPWSMSAGVLCSNSACPGETAHGGTGFAWMNGYGAAHTDSVTQTVTIPAGRTSASLAFYLHIDTRESGTTVHDTLKVQVLGSTGTVKSTLATYSNRNAAAGYALKTLSLNSYIGQTVTIRFLGTEDASLATSFIVDDVTLTVQ